MIYTVYTSKLLTCLFNCTNFFSSHKYPVLPLLHNVDLIYTLSCEEEYIFLLLLFLLLLLLLLLFRIELQVDGMAG